MKNANAYAIPITLDRPRRMRYDVNALSELEIALGGRSFTEVLSGEMGIATIRAFLWASLLHEDRGITLERAGILMQKAIDGGMELADLLGAISQAITSCGIFKKADDEAEAGENPPPAAAA
jgi:hypothetical protein